MKIKENKGAMIGIMVLIMLVSTLTSGVMQINRLTRNVNQEFVVGEKKDGLSISRDLSTRITRAKNILQIAKNYIPESDTDFKDIQDSIAILTEKEDKHALYQANENLQASVDSLYARLQELDVSAKNLQALKEEKSVFDNAMNTISYDPYNQLVSDFEKKTDTIPGNIFSQFTKDVEYFK